MSGPDIVVRNDAIKHTTCDDCGASVLWTFVESVPVAFDPVWLDAMHELVCKLRGIRTYELRTGIRRAWAVERTVQQIELTAKYRPDERLLVVPEHQCTERN